MVFCFKNCSYWLWEKNCSSVREKILNIWGRIKVWIFAKILRSLEQYTISNSERSEQFLKQILFLFVTGGFHGSSTLAGVFYNVKNGSSFITSKSWSENLSNHNKHLCFRRLQDKVWIKIPKWTIFLISSRVFVLITEIFWRTFWRNKWRSVFDVVKDSSFWFYFFTDFLLEIISIPRMLQNRFRVG